MRKKRGEKKMATQIAETPILYGKDAEAVLRQISAKPSKTQVNNMLKKMEQKFNAVQTRRD